MTVKTDYGSTLTKGGTAVGKCKIIDFPELKTDKVPTTNHAGGGVTSKIPSKLVDVGDITVEVLMEAGMLAAMYAEEKAGTVSSVVITNAIDTITGDGFYTSVKEESADAEKPDAVRASVVITFSSDVIITTTP